MKPAPSSLWLINDRVIESIYEPAMNFAVLRGYSICARCCVHNCQRFFSSPSMYFIMLCDTGDGMIINNKKKADASTLHSIGFIGGISREKKSMTTKAVRVMSRHKNNKNYSRSASRDAFNCETRRCKRLNIAFRI